MKHVVMYSGGKGSWAAGMRVKESMSPGDELIFLFADVKGKSQSPHIGEDPDCYRFISESAKQIGARLVVLNTGKTIWDVFKEARFLGNSRLAKCSHELKQKPCRRWLEENTTPGDSVVYVGIDWTEIHRLEAIQAAYLPWKAEAPLTQPPYLDTPQVLSWIRETGLEPPRMYGYGFPHANCGGGCVRAGQAQFALLLKVWPDRYAEWERQEQRLRDHLGKPVSILRDQRGGETKPLTLTELRQRIESAPQQLDILDWGGCGCFVDEVPR